MENEKKRPALTVSDAYRTANTAKTAAEKERERIAAVPVKVRRKRSDSLTPYDSEKAAAKAAAKAATKTRKAATKKTSPAAAAPKAITTRRERRTDPDASLSRYAMKLKRAKKRITGNVTEDMVKQLSTPRKPKADNGPYVDVLDIAWQGGAPGLGKRK